jgi:hypothetical protein
MMSTTGSGESDKRDGFTCAWLWIIGKIESHSKMALMHLYIWYGLNMYVTLLLITFHPARNEYYSLQIYVLPVNTTSSHP